MEANGSEVDETLEQPEELIDFISKPKRDIERIHRYRSGAFIWGKEDVLYVFFDPDHDSGEKPTIVPSFNELNYVSYATSNAGAAFVFTENRKKFYSWGQVESGGSCANYYTPKSPIRRSVTSLNSTLFVEGNSLFICNKTGPHSITEAPFNLNEDFQFYMDNTDVWYIYQGDNLYVFSGNEFIDTFKTNFVHHEQNYLVWKSEDKTSWYIGSLNDWTDFEFRDYNDGLDGIHTTGHDILPRAIIKIDSKMQWREKYIGFSPFSLLFENQETGRASMFYSFPQGFNDEAVPLAFTELELDVKPQHLAGNNILAINLEHLETRMYTWPFQSYIEVPFISSSPVNCLGGGLKIFQTGSYANSEISFYCFDENNKLFVSDSTYYGAENIETLRNKIESTKKAYFHHYLQGGTAYLISENGDIYSPKPELASLEIKAISGGVLGNIAVITKSNTFLNENGRDFRSTSDIERNILPELVDSFDIGQGDVFHLEGKNFKYYKVLTKP